MINLEAYKSDSHGTKARPLASIRLRIPTTARKNNPQEERHYPTDLPKTGLRSHPAIHIPYYDREQLTQHGKDTMECATERSEDHMPADTVQACSKQSEKVLRIGKSRRANRTELAVN
uniref:Uncharacterized protein n=1 Tax=Acrobeloides nanus TaxID=290746 RepID=A0A914E9U0_9BILA